MANRQKLELTWIGKDIQPKLEPRILIEDPDKSYGDRHTENMLIHGDNLLALKALEQDFAGRIKCGYIDPPFNTQQAFEHYDDGLEHSIWLSLIRDRIEQIHRLLSDDGTLFVHIDDNELGYLVVLLDEIFGRTNRISIITFKQGSRSLLAAEVLLETPTFMHLSSDKSVLRKFSPLLQSKMLKKLRRAGFA